MRLGLQLKKKENKLIQQQQEQQLEQKEEEFKIEYVLDQVQDNAKQFLNQENIFFKQIIQKQKEKNALIIQKDSIYIGEFDTIKKCGLGKIYIQQYDAYCNNSYFVYEGQFENDSIEGYGIQYYGKTNKKKAEGRFHNLIMIEKKQEYNEDGSIKQQQQQQLQQSTFFDDKEDRNGSKLFRIKSAKQNVPQQSHQKQQKQNDSWNKFDVIISKDDLSSLLAERAINKTVMEAYINFINFYDKEQFFNLKTIEQIKAYQRIIIIPYFLLENQKIDIINHFIEFAFLKGQFWIIYQKIVFIVNQNGHWFLIEAIFEGLEVKFKVYDSQSKKKSIFYVTICKHIWSQIEILIKHYNLNITWKSKDVLVIDCSQLNNPNDSGIYTCLYIKQIQQNKQLDQLNQEQANDMRKNELFNLIKKEK